MANLGLHRDSGSRSAHQLFAQRRHHQQPAQAIVEGDQPEGEGVRQAPCGFPPGRAVGTAGCRKLSTRLPWHRPVDWPARPAVRQVLCAVQQSRRPIPGRDGRAADSPSGWCGRDRPIAHRARCLGTPASSRRACVSTIMSAKVTANPSHRQTASLARKRGSSKAWALRLPSSLRAKSITDRCARNAASLSSNCCNAARLRTLGVGRKALRKDSIVRDQTFDFGRMVTIRGCTYSASYQKKLERRSTAPGEDKAEHTLRVHASHRRASRVGIFVRVLAPSQETSKRQRGVTGMAQKLDTAQMQKYWSKTSRLMWTIFALWIVFSFVIPLFARPAQRHQVPGLPARLLHGRAGLADRLRRAVHLERDRAEQDRRRIRRPGRLRRGR